MRKALIGLILAATAMVPATAQAQHWRDRGQNQDGGEDRSSQVEQRHHERSQERQVQQAPQQQVQQAPQVQVVERQRGGDNNRGNWQGRGGGDNNNRGNWQGRGGDNNNDRSNWQSRGGDNGGGNWRRGDRSNQGSIYPQAWQGNPNDPRLRHYQELERRNQQGYDNDRRGDRRGDWRNDRRDDRRGDWRNDNRGSRNNWNRNWRNDNRYDWQRYRYSNRNRFHIGPYYSPYRGYGYNRFSIGIFLDPFFYDQRYWIGDPWQYRLPPAEPGTEWVRYYNDVLLVDIYTGEVLDTIYDFFW
jgi:hypothetical protein